MADVAISSNMVHLHYKGVITCPKKEVSGTKMVGNLKYVQDGHISVWVIGSEELFAQS